MINQDIQNILPTPPLSNKNNEMSNLENVKMKPLDDEEQTQNYNNISFLQEQRIGGRGEEEGDDDIFLLYNEIFQNPVELQNQQQLMNMNMNLEENEFPPSFIMADNSNNTFISPTVVNQNRTKFSINKNRINRSNSSNHTFTYNTSLPDNANTVTSRNALINQAILARKAKGTTSLTAGSTTLLNNSKLKETHSHTQISSNTNPNPNLNLNPNQYLNPNRNGSTLISTSSNSAATTLASASSAICQNIKSSIPSPMVQTPFLHPMFSTPSFPYLNDSTVSSNDVSSPLFEFTPPSTPPHAHSNNGYSKLKKEYKPTSAPTSTAAALTTATKVIKATTATSSTSSTTSSTTAATIATTTSAISATSETVTEGVTTTMDTTSAAAAAALAMLEKSPQLCSDVYTGSSTPNEQIPPVGAFEDGTDATSSAFLPMLNLPMKKLALFSPNVDDTAVTDIYPSSYNYLDDPIVNSPLLPLNDDQATTSHLLPLYNTGMYDVQSPFLMENPDEGYIPSGNISEDSMMYSQVSPDVSMASTPGLFDTDNTTNELILKKMAESNPNILNEASPLLGLEQESPYLTEQERDYKYALAQTPYLSEEEIMGMESPFLNEGSSFANSSFINEQRARFANRSSYLNKQNAAIAAALANRSAYLNKQKVNAAAALANHSAYLNKQKAAAAAALANRANRAAYLNKQRAAAATALANRTAYLNKQNAVAATAIANRAAYLNKQKAAAAAALANRSFFHKQNTAYLNKRNSLTNSSYINEQDALLANSPFLSEEASSSLDNSPFVGEQPVLTLNDTPCLSEQPVLTLNDSPSLPEQPIPTLNEPSYLPEQPAFPLNRNKATSPALIDPRYAATTKSSTNPINPAYLLSKKRKMGVVNYPYGPLSKIQCIQGKERNSLDEVTYGYIKKNDTRMKPSPLLQEISLETELMDTIPVTSNYLSANACANKVRPTDGLNPSHLSPNSNTITSTTFSNSVKPIVETEQININVNNNVTTTSNPLKNRMNNINDSINNSINSNINNIKSNINNNTVANVNTTKMMNIDANTIPNTNINAINTNVSTTNTTTNSITTSTTTSTSTSTTASIPSSNINSVTAAPIKINNSIPANSMKLTVPSASTYSTLKKSPLSPAALMSQLQTDSNYINGYAAMNLSIKKPPSLVSMAGIKLDTKKDKVKDKSKKDNDKISKTTSKTKTIAQKNKPGRKPTKEKKAKKDVKTNIKSEVKPEINSGVKSNVNPGGEMIQMKFEIDTNNKTPIMGDPTTDTTNGIITPSITPNNITPVISKNGFLTPNTLLSVDGTKKMDYHDIPTISLGNTPNLDMLSPASSSLGMSTTSNINASPLLTSISYNLNSNIQLVKKRAKKKYPCTYPGCTKTFSRPCHRQSHERSHENSRPFVCPECKRAFCRKHDMIRHQRIHSKERPYQCSICKRKFARGDALVRHRTRPTSSCFQADMALAKKIRQQQHRLLQQQQQLDYERLQREKQMEEAAAAAAAAASNSNANTNVKTNNNNTNINTNDNTNTTVITNTNANTTGKR